MHTKITPPRSLPVIDIPATQKKGIRNTKRNQRKHPVLTTPMNAKKDGMIMNTSPNQNGGLSPADSDGSYDPSIADRIAAIPDLTARVVILPAQVRTNLVAKYSTCRHIRQDAFQTVSDFDAHLPIVDRQEQQYSIVVLSCTKLPGTGHGQSVLLHRVPAQRRDNEYGNLVAGLALMITQERRDFLLDLRPQDTGRVHDAPGQWWNRGLSVG